MLFVYCVFDPWTLVQEPIVWANTTCFYPDHVFTAKPLNSQVPNQSNALLVQYIIISLLVIVPGHRHGFNVYQPVICQSPYCLLFVTWPLDFGPRTYCEAHCHMFIAEPRVYCQNYLARGLTSPNSTSYHQDPPDHLIAQMDPVTSSISINLTLPFKGPLDCPICHRPQKTLSDLKTHGKRTHQLEKILSPTCCLLCNRNFPSFKQASCHFRHCNSKQDPRHPPTTTPTTFTSTDMAENLPTVPSCGDRNDNGARNSLDGRTDSYPYTQPLPLDTLTIPISTAAPKAEDHVSLPTLSPNNRNC